MELSLTTRVEVPDDVYLQEIEGEAAILHLTSERYFGLDDVGTRMWHALVASPSIGTAVERLLDVYDVDRGVLERDLLGLASTLVERGLLSPTGG